MNVSWIVVALCLGLSACSSEPGESGEITQARRRADEHLSYLRAGNWEKAADLVAVITYLNASYLQVPLDSPSRAPRLRSGQAERTRLRSKAIEILSRTYGHVKPGEIRGSGALVNGDHLNELEQSRIGKRVRFSYRHEDLDGLEMLWVDANWYRVLEVSD